MKCRRYFARCIANIVVVMIEKQFVTGLDCSGKIVTMELVSEGSPPW